MGARDQDARKPLRVLLVEDEFVVSMTLRVQLEALGCEVVGTAKDANTGIDMAESLQPDVILMDIGLRGKSGVEATREIMQIAPTKVIVVTAYGDDRVRQALEAGARVVLMKPVLEEQLAQALTEVTGRECRPVQRDDVEES
jgi:DNA-binding NarL/FixJ family response regulator